MTELAINGTRFITTHKQNLVPNWFLSVPHFDPISIKKTVTSHSRPCNPMSFTVSQTKASSLSAGTELGAAATVVSSLYWQSQSSQQH